MTILSPAASESTEVHITPMLSKFIDMKKKIILFVGVFANRLLQTSFYTSNFVHLNAVSVSFSVFQQLMHLFNKFILIKLFNLHKNWIRLK